MAEPGGKKLTTAEILAKARAEAAAKAGGEAPAPAAEPETPAVETPAPKAAVPAAPAAKPKSTADILAAARAQAALKAAGGTPAPTEEATPAPAAAAPPAAAAGKPKSTADILAAARAQAALKAAGGEAPSETASAPVAAAGAKPKSTADVLAAARAQAAAKAAGGAAPATAKPATAKPAAGKTAKAAPAAVASTEGLTVEQMLAAVRSPATVSSTAVPTAPVAEPKAVKVAPPMPPRPTPAAKKGEDTRRSFFWELTALVVAVATTPFAFAWGALVVYGGLMSLLTARFMLPNVLTEPPRKFKIGSPNDYDLGTVATKWVAAFGVWIVHTDQYQGRNMIYALASVCTHLGCTPSWLESEQKFKCPCHGSGFYITGVNFEGPAPRPLERVGVRIAEDGMLEVDKSLKFQEEMGQWTDGNSFVEIA